MEGNLVVAERVRGFEWVDRSGRKAMTMMRALWVNELYINSLSHRERAGVRGFQMNLYPHIHAYSKSDFSDLANQSVSKASTWRQALAARAARAYPPSRKDTARP